MLSRQHKLSRVSFPAHKDPRLNWVGSVLRIQAHSFAVPMRNKVNDETPVLFAVVVAKRQSDNAVMRHRFKRQVFAVVAGKLARFEGLPYRKYIILPKEHLRTITSERILSDIEVFLSEQERR